MSEERPETRCFGFSDGRERETTWVCERERERGEREREREKRAMARDWSAQEGNLREVGCEREKERWGREKSEEYFGNYNLIKKITCILGGILVF